MMTRRTRTIADRYIPQGSIKVQDKESDAVAYLYMRAGKTGPRLGAVIYYGKQSRPVSHYTYHNEQRREANVKSLFESRRKSLAYKSERSAERKAWVNDYKVGDILGTCWGYDQTNREYFEVVGVRGKHVFLRELQQKQVDSAGGAAWSGSTVPLPGAYHKSDEAPLRKLAQQHGVRIDEVRWASRRTPKIIAGVPVYEPEYWSAYA